jgi:hypothetical protein
LASLGPGKSVAQGSHCANQCVADYRKRFPDPSEDDLLALWEAETGNGFGTTIVLGVDERKLRSRIGYAQHLGLHAGILHDPTYPLLDGQVLHLIPLDTCGYIFCRKSQGYPVVGDLSLMP